MKVRAWTWLGVALACTVSACTNAPPVQRPRAALPTTTDEASESSTPPTGISMTYADLLPQETVIPLVRHRDMLFVHATIDGYYAGEFLVDTGTATNAIIAEVADQLGLPEFTEAPVAGVHTQSTASVRKVSHLSIGGVDVASELIAAIALDEVSRYTGTRVAGIIGFPALAQVPFAIDFRAATLTLYNPAHFVPPAADVTLLRVYHDQPYVAATCADGGEALLLLDTGATVPVVLWRSFVTLVPSVASAPKGWATTFGAGGGAQVATAELRHLHLFGRDVEDVAVIVQAAPPTAWKHSRAAGIVGLPLLRDRRLTIRASSHQVWVEPP